LEDRPHPPPMGTRTRRQQGPGAPERGAPPDPAEPPTDAQGPPRFIGRFEVLGELGRGGMGVVYRARDPQLDRIVALKVLPPHLNADPQARARLLKEAHAVSALNHANICTIHEAGLTTGGGLYLVMPCYEGETLAARLARGPLPVDEAVGIAAQLARGLAAAHRKQIVHRDLKPSNVLLAHEDGGDAVAMILDFGVAKSSGAALTEAGGSVGTLGYAAPEQARGETSPRVDLWALGVVLYEMLAGRRPFEAPYEAAVLYAVLHEPPPPLRERRPEVPERVAALVARLLEKDPAARLQTAEEVEEALALRSSASRRRAHPGGTSTQGASRRGIRKDRAGLRHGWRPTRRHSAVFLGGALALLAGLGVWSPARNAVLARAGVLPAERHIAVLPLAAPGASADDHAFADGLAELLSSELTRFEAAEQALWVVPFSEVRAQEVASPGAARRALGATLVVTGSVQRMGDRLRVPLNLVDARTLRQLRAETLDLPSAELATLPAVAAAALQRMLQVELGPASRTAGAPAAAPGGTTDARAYAYYVQGLGYLQQWDDEDALQKSVRLFQRSLGEDPDFALAHARLGLAYWRLFQATSDAAWVERAEAASERAVELAPDASAPLVTLAHIRAQTGPVGEAVRAAHRALALDPASDEAHLALARAQQASGNFEEAERQYREAQRRKPGYWGGYHALGSFYLTRGRDDEALEQFRQVVRLAPGGAQGYVALGNVHYRALRLDSAREMYEQSIARRPSYDALSNLGVIYYDEGRYVDAVRTFERALDLDSNQHQVWANLAWAYEESPPLRGRAPAAFREAVRLAEALRTLTPDDPRLLSDLATYYLEVGEPERAREPIMRALRRDPQNVEVAFSAALVYEALGERDAALRWARQAMTGSGGYPLSYIEETPELQGLLPALRPARP
jgi:tetratricopeptide (TPR) repeat protein